MTELKAGRVGELRGRKEPIDIGMPCAVVFLIKKGIGMDSGCKSSSTLLRVLLSRKRLGTNTSGARDLVVIVLKKKLQALIYRNIFL